MIDNWWKGLSVRAANALIFAGHTSKESVLSWLDGGKSLQQIDGIQSALEKEILAWLKQTSHSIDIVTRLRTLPNLNRDICDAADIIDSQRLALEEKDARIKNLENNWSVKTSFQCHCNTTKDDGFCAACSLSFAEEALDEKDKEIAKLNKELDDAAESRYELQGRLGLRTEECQQLQSRVKELEARIQHMDNACLDNFGVTITSILD